MSRLLLIDGDEDARQALEAELRDRGHDVAGARALEGLHEYVDQMPDAIVLDLGMPNPGGLVVLDGIRALSEVPVVVVASRAARLDVVRALDQGADDYLVKPFSIDQLDARLRAVLRRADPRHEQIVVGDLRIDAGAREATLGDDRLELTRLEFDLLTYLARNRRRVVGKRELMTEIWGQPLGGADKTVDVHLSSLRRKLGETAGAPRYLRATRGVGIRLVDPDLGGSTDEA
jgi:DNA-binding response OmpR family regulator